MKKNLFILPFDHRDSFIRGLFDFSNTLNAEEIVKIKHFKQVIYQGFKIAMSQTDQLQADFGILVDEQFGEEIIQDAKINNFLCCVCVEKSGQAEFTLEFGEDFGAHINRLKPDFVKALVRYNPEEDSALNQRQIQKLKLVSDFCVNYGYKFMLEPLVVATEQQKQQVGGDLSLYDQEMRPSLMETMIEELQEGGVNPDIWKIEGLEHSEDYEILANQVLGYNANSRIIILGRNTTNEQVVKWLKAGAVVEGVSGFAVGRTLFWEPLVAYRDTEITAQQASQIIADKFLMLCRAFNEFQVK